MAGLELASTLKDARDLEVILVEAGLDLGRRHIYAALPETEATGVWLLDGRDACFHRPWRSCSPPHYQGRSGLRRRVGGRAAYWYGVGLPIEPWALMDPAWPREVVADLAASWRGGASLYDRVRDDLEDWSGFRATGPEVRIGAVSLSPTPRYTRSAEVGWSAWAAWDALSTKNLTLLTNSVVDRVVMRGSKVVGLHLESDRDLIVPAETVVLAAGAIECARLCAAAWQETGRVVPPLTVHDHLVTGVYARYTGPVAARLREALPEGRWFTPVASARSNLFIELLPSANGCYTLDLQLTGEQHPNAEVTLSFEDNRHARIKARLSKSDRRQLAQQREVLHRVWRDIWERSGMACPPLKFPRYARGNGNVAILTAEDDMPVCWTNELGTEDHESGTWPFGPLLDANSRVTAIDGLYVLGPAAFPRAGAANPALTILALARRLGSYLATQGTCPA